MAKPSTCVYTQMVLGMELSGHTLCQAAYYRQPCVQWAVQGYLHSYVTGDSLLIWTIVALLCNT